jgi:hypothetical protein
MWNDHCPRVGVYPVAVYYYYYYYYYPDGSIYISGAAN